ncbi:unnamed protein product [Symbiodinium sp. CCMP2592]|nr:unnamed protein product [Symbiodinium sp. CCMP2592]
MMLEQADKEMAAEAREQALEVFGTPAPTSLREKSQPSERRDSAQELEVAAARRSKWPKAGSKGQAGDYGKGSYHGSWKDSRASTDPWSPWEPTPLTEAEKELLRNMAKMLMRHESEMRLLRQDYTWMCFVDTAETGILELLRNKTEDWQRLYQERKVTCSLRVVLLIVVFQELLTRMNALQQDQEKLTKMHTVGWLVEGSQALNPCWTYQQWSPENQKTERSSRAPLAFTAAQEAIQTIIDNVGGSSVCVVLSVRGKQADRVHQALCLLNGCACFAVAGLRFRPDRGQQSQLAKALETSYTGVPFSDWQPRRQQWTKPQKTAEEDDL